MASHRLTFIPVLCIEHASNHSLQIERLANWGNPEWRVWWFIVKCCHFLL